MINKLASIATTFYIQSKIVDEQEREVYQYGLELLISTFINIALIAALSIPFGHAAESLFFFFAFALLRTAAGGYHAKTHGSCIATFTIVYFMFLLLIECIPAQFALIYIFTAVTMTAAIVWVLAPIQTDKKPLTSDEKNELRKKSLIIVSLEMAFVLFVFMFTAKQYQNFEMFVVSGFFAAAISLAAAWIISKHANAKEERKL